ncbi:Uncharacterised protein [Streptococcus pneumoniae]|nr:hypothetical protein [Streptococcus pneumoniae]VIV37156.1 Uncharacterised protein [Streptococcus pneumoniae]VIW93197.1 Uncharacterised protein [Streptococcus pneumoniae]VJP47479.1 Uncharacterised protein [Streptococcus pneumoniae]VOI24506.1 Uncharacterised protein [Streptococcus pneumoniae]
MNKEIIDDYETLIASMEVVIMALETVERFLVKAETPWRSKARKGPKYILNIN